MNLSHIISLLTLFFLLVPYLSFGQVPPPGLFPPPEIPTKLFSCLPTDPLRICVLRLLDDVLKVILVIALAAAAIMVSWAGLLYLFKGADEKVRGEAKTRLIYAAVGLVVAFLAWVMTVILARVISGGAPAI
jgi:hypothetical protein